MDDTNVCSDFPPPGQVLEGLAAELETFALGFVEITYYFDPL